MSNSLIRILSVSPLVVMWLAFFIGDTFIVYEHWTGFPLFVTLVVVFCVSLEAAMNLWFGGKAKNAWLDLINKDKDVC